MAISPDRIDSHSAGAILLLLSCLLLFIQSCGSGDTPFFPEIGDGRGGELPRTATFTPLEFVNHAFAKPTGYAANLVVGRNRFFSASSMLRYNIPVSWNESDEVFYSITLCNHTQTSLDPLTVGVSVIESPWWEYEYKTGDDLSVMEELLSTFTFYGFLDTAQVASLPDSAGDFIETLELENGMKLRPYGVLLEPLDSASVKTFYSGETSSPPELEITVRDSDGRTRKVPPISPEDDTFIVTLTDSVADLREDHLIIGRGGMVQRSLLRFGLLDSIPEDAMINRAELTLKIDQDNSFYETLTIGVWEGTDDYWNGIFEDTTITATLPLVGYQMELTRDMTEISFDTTVPVQNWVTNRGDEENGFLLAAMDDTQDASMVSFFAADSITLKNPVLSVTYTRPPASWP